MVDTIEFTETEYKVATGVARRIARIQNYYIEVDDIQQECYLWMVKNPERVYTWREEGKKGKAKLGTALYRAGMRYVIRERVKRTGTESSDHAFYSEAVLHELLPDVFDYDSWSMESFMEDQERKAPSRPSEGNTRLAMLVDVKFAVDALSEDDRGLLRDRFADGGMTVSALAAVHQTHETTIRRRIRNTLRKLADRLGGEPPWM
jgi:DNA-directed RNA polymerase specialized sigma24 family protein